MVEILFWVSVALITYAYAGYPLMITVLSVLRNRKVRTADIEPAVSLLISAYNEEGAIEAKLRNSLELDYPRDKLEIVVASDGSTDRTDEIVKRFGENDPRVPVVLHRVEGRLGKTEAQNSAVKICRGEIVVFSDAASLFDRGALRALVRNYADPSVGAVSGMYKYVNPTGGSVGFATMVFWNMENFIKKRETRVGGMLGCCGCIYSVRKDLYTELPGTIISDLVEPLMIVQKGYRVVFEPGALAFEETTESPRQEFKMRVRVIVRGMNGVIYARRVLNPVRHGWMAVQLLSHKVVRWLVPVYAMGALGSAILLWNRGLVYRGFVILAALVLCLAGMGFVAERRGVRMKILYFPLYFVIVNLASLASLFKVLWRRKIVRWETQR